MLVSIFIINFCKTVLVLAGGMLATALVYWLLYITLVLVVTFSCTPPTFVSIFLYVYLDCKNKVRV